MERGLVLTADRAGHVFDSPLYVPPLEFVPATSDVHPDSDGQGVLIHSNPSRREARTHPEQVLVWYHCKACRLLHYPQPTPL